MICRNRGGVDERESGIAGACQLIEKRGRLADADQQRFIDAGYSAEQILEVIAVVAASTITNYTASVTQPVLEQPFAAFAWDARVS